MGRGSVRRVWQRVEKSLNVDYNKVLTVKVLFVTESLVW